MSFQATNFNPFSGNFESGLPVIVNTPDSQTVKPMYQENPGLFECTPGSGKGATYTKTETTSVADLGIKSKLFSNATNKGMPVRHESDIKDSTLLTISGMEIQAKQAANLGLITRNSDGSYSGK